MKRKKRSFLGIERLEERQLFADYVLSGSTLTVSNLSGLTPTLTADVGAGTIAVTDDGGPTLTFNATSLVVNGTNLNDTITVTGGGTLAGKLTINSGNGNDLVSIVPPASSATST
jgi:hypothetical protein